MAKILSRKIDFQKSQTTWIELAEEDHLKNNVLLKDLLKTTKIAENLPVSKEINKDLYIPRTFLYQRWLKSDVLNELSSDEIVYNQQDFETQCKTNKNVHWLEKIDENFKWIKSSENVTKFFEFIDKTEKPFEEEYFASSSTRAIILIDIAGMGKSTVLNHLAQLLKENHANNWIAKIDLNDHTSELEKIKADDLKTPKQAIEFLINKIFKIDSDFERNLLWKSCESKENVVLLFDGFDEVASYYRDQVTQLIRSLLETAVGKIFIASRPECAEYLEEEFSQTKH
jgi:energy-coupling factor transporter ATP-binding protein EcfA2